MSMGRSWTTKKAERVWKQLRGGMNVHTLASMHGCTVTNIHRRLRTAGYDPHGANVSENVESNRSSLIYARRKAGVEFNEIAVEAFLDRRLRFGDIAPVIESVLAQALPGDAGSVEGVLVADAAARRAAAAAVARRAC
jgi:hypothetical protein